MPVYVDRAKHPLGRMAMCHLLADSLDELHTMAATIGIQRKWFQDHSTPHYDICQAKRRDAIKAGAIEISRKEVVALIRFWRNKTATTLNNTKVK